MLPLSTPHPLPSTLRASRPGQDGWSVWYWNVHLVTGHRTAATAGPPPPSGTDMLVCVGVSLCIFMYACACFVSVCRYVRNCLSATVHLPVCFCLCDVCVLACPCLCGWGCVCVCVCV